MKFSAILFTLLVVLCVQISGQSWRDRRQGARRPWRRFNRWGDRNDRRGMLPKFLYRRLPPWFTRDQPSTTFAPITSKTTTLPVLTTQSTVRDLPKTSTISSTFPGASVLDPLELLRKIAGLPGGLPGGLNEVPIITQEHRDIAAFAAVEIGREYTMTNVTKVKEQVVQGINYHMDITVTKSKASVIIALECEVIVHHIPWLAVQDINTLTYFSCSRIPTRSL